jgi:ABC-type Fe3+ transport system permease subunit
MKVRPRTIKRTIATAELLLIAPAALFMSALFVRNLQPEQYEPAHSAQRIVMWYAARLWTLWVLLMALPFAVLVAGCVTLLRGWHHDTELRQAARQTLAAIRAHLPTLCVAAATVAAAGVLAIVALHSLTD